MKILKYYHSSPFRQFRKAFFSHFVKLQIAYYNEIEIQYFYFYRSTYVCTLFFYRSMYVCMLLSLENFSIACWHFYLLQAFFTVFKILIILTSTPSYITFYSDFPLRNDSFNNNNNRMKHIKWNSFRMYNFIISSLTVSNLIIINFESMNFIKLSE